MIARFGPAGSADSFHTMGYRKTAQMPEYLTRMELDAFEYQCGRGVRISREAAQELGRLSAEKDIRLSLHAPYFISLSSLEEEKRMGSIDYILQSAVAADAMGADRIIVHSGSASKISRSDALELAKDTLRKAQKTLDEQGLSHIHICPETMGKINQLGTLDEVIEQCRVSPVFAPVVDFGHLNARELGGAFLDVDDYRRVFQTIGEQLGEKGSHFLRIGRSLIINIDYIYLIDVSKQQLVLSDCAGCYHELSASREVLIKLKAYMESLSKKQNG